MDTILITNSRMQAFRKCQRYHQISYGLGYRPVLDTAALEFGDAMHFALEAWWGAYMRGEPPLRMTAATEALSAKLGEAQSLDATMQAKAEVMLLAYDARWSEAMEEWEVLAVERQFEDALRSPVTGRRARGLRIAGKIDKVARRRSDGTVWTVEHKTTGSDLSAASTYWQRLRLDSQVSLYYDGAASLGYQIAGCLYDVIGKPDMKPYKATPVESRKYTKDGRLYANQRENDETPDEFRSRLAEEVATNVERYLQRTDVIRLDTEIDDARRDTYETALQIRDSLKTGRAPRNVGACFQYGTGAPCSCYDVCSGAASLDDEYRFRKLDSVHPELSL